jgi:hypothetical protein
MKDISKVDEKFQKTVKFYYEKGKPQYRTKKL